MNHISSTREDFADISLRDIAAPLFRRKRVLAATFLVVFIASILAAILMPPKFTSHMEILVNRERVDPVVTTEATTQLLNTSDPVTEDEINSEVQLLKSRDVLEKVVLANGLAKAPEHSLLAWLHLRRNQADRVNRAVQSLAKNLNVSAVTKANVIDVSYSSSNPRLSYGVLNTLGSLYLEKHIEVHRPPGSFQFFTEETQKYHQALEAAEARLRSFGKQPDAAAPDLERTDTAAQVAASFGQLHLAEQSIAADQHRIQSDREQMKLTPARSATKQDVDAADLLLQNLGTALLTAETKRTQLLSKYNPSYPLVQEADREVAQAQAAIQNAEKNPYTNQETDRDPTYELLREDLAKTEADLAAQRADLAAIRHSIQDLQARMADLDQKALTQQDLLRDVKANETNYLLYLSKREQERTSDALDKTRIANVAIAVPPAIPALPSRSAAFILLVGFCFALLLSVAIAYLVEYFDTSFHTPAQVIDILGISVVVNVPKKTA